MEKDCFFPGGGGTGICSDYGIGQSRFLWFLRGLPKVSKIFASLWDTEDLLTSFDGCGVFRPAEYLEQQLPKGKPNSWATRGGWLHVDQNGLKKPDMVCVQGLLNLYPSGEDEGGLVVVQKSHLFFKDLFHKYEITSPSGPDYVPLDRFTIPELWNENTKILKICLNPGDFTLWDSRTVHCSHPANYKGREIDDPIRLRRLAAYICMTPTSFAKNLDELIPLRVEAFRSAQTTTHWPHEFTPSYKKLNSSNWKYPEMSLRQVELLVGKERTPAFLDQVKQLFSNQGRPC